MESSIYRFGYEVQRDDVTRPEWHSLWMGGPKWDPDLVATVTCFVPTQVYDFSWTSTDPGKSEVYKMLVLFYRREDWGLEISSLVIWPLPFFLLLRLELRECWATSPAPSHLKDFAKMSRLVSNLRPFWLSLLSSWDYRLIPRNTAAFFERLLGGGFA